MLSKRYFPLRYLNKEKECVDPPCGIHPPVNYEKSVSGSYVLSVAIAGYDPRGITLSLDGNLLIISSCSSEDDGVADYIFKGIAGRAFKHVFLVDGFANVTKTSILNGILRIEINYHIPDNRSLIQVEDIQQIVSHTRLGSK